MGSKTSKTDVFEYHERVVYFHDKKIVSRDITNNKIDKTVNFPIGIDTFDQKDSKILKLGGGFVAITTLDDHNAMTVCLDGQLNVIKFAYGQNKGESVRSFIDMISPLEKCTSMNSLIDARQINLLRLNVNEIESLCEDHTFKLETKPDIKFERHTDIMDITFEGKQVIIIGYSYWHKSNFGIYDTYDDILVLIGVPHLSVDLHICYSMEFWKKQEDQWTLQSSASVRCPKAYSHNIFSMKWKNVLSTPQHYILEAVIVRSTMDNGLMDYGCMYVINKKTLKHEYFPGCQVVVRDDYDWWFKKSVKFLKRINCLAKMSEDLLRIILSYSV